MREIKWGKWASVTVTLIGGAIAFYLAFRYLLVLLLPFGIAVGIACLIRPPAARLAARTKIPRAIWAAILLIVIIGGVLFLLGVATRRLVLELDHLLDRLLSTGESLDPVGMLTDRIGFLGSVGASERADALRNMISQMLSGAASALSEEIPAFLGRVLAALPTVLLVTLITVIAGFYFSIDGDRIFSALTEHLPDRVRTRLPLWRARLRRVSWKYLRAYLLLWGLTVVELFIGFAILRLDYAFLLALVIAFVDLLPIFGVGTVLIPWAVVALLQQNYFLGFGLFILYGVALILRQIIEPHLLGQSLGLHPLLTLFATYAGWQLFGFFGMLLAPFVALLAKSALAEIKK